MAKRGKYSSTKAYGDCEGPFGFPMQSETASELETLIKSLPLECKTLLHDGPIHKSFGAEIDADEDTRTEVSTVSTDSVDRDSEIVDPFGLNWSQWSKSPVVTWAHNYSALPVGRGLWSKFFQKNGQVGYLAKTEYIKKPSDWEGEWFADAVWHYVKSGFLNGKSIGFIPTKVSMPSQDQINQNPILKDVNFVIDEATVIEYAVCPVQSNPDAIIEVAEKGLYVPEVILSDLGVTMSKQITKKVEKKSADNGTVDKYGRTLDGGVLQKAINLTWQEFENHEVTWKVLVDEWTDPQSGRNYTKGQTFKVDHSKQSDIMHNAYMEAGHREEIEAIAKNKVKSATSQKEDNEETLESKPKKNLVSSINAALKGMDFEAVAKEAVNEQKGIF